MKDQRQKWFDIIWGRARTKQRAENEFTGCLYRSPGTGCACFVGVLIPDGEYTKKIEGLPVDAILSRIPSLRRTTSEDQAFLVKVQHIHDEWEPSQWDERLRELAEEWHLTVPGEGLEALQPEAE